MVDEVKDQTSVRRQQMVEGQLRRRGIRDETVLTAMLEVPRHRFVRAAEQDEAYADHPLPIGEGQTISQPYMVARMIELCRSSAAARVLEIGAGCGYQTAVLARLARWVYAVELRPALLELARENLAALAVDNVSLRQGDGSEGWAEHAPYDAILVAAGAQSVPPALLEQLAEGGRLVIPVGPRSLQMLQVHERHGARVECSKDTACRFVELQGAYGW